jgi:predicted enzyme related to lactoylglutathione lyase
MPPAPPTGPLAWVGLAAADQDVAVEFYTAAFGWEAARETDHTRLGHAGRDVALVYQQTPQARAANVTSHWSPFFLVPDADPAVERAVESGGTALRDPFDVTGGRVAPLEDPVGAIFSVWSPRPPGSPEPIPGDAWWLELSTPDVAASEAFYGGLFGWSYEESPDAPSIRGPDRHIGSIRRAEGPPAWSPCLRVTDADAAGRRAEAGGAASVGAAEDAATGRVVSIVDPQGAALSLLEPR